MQHLALFLLQNTWACHCGKKKKTAEKYIIELNKNLERERGRGRKKETERDREREREERERE